MIEREISVAPIRILLVDDHAVVRAGLRLLLELHALQVVGEASTVEEAMAIQDEISLVIADLMLGGQGGAQVVGRLQARFPGAAIFVLTMVADPGEVQLALSLGARGYLLKEAAAGDLIEAVTRVARGESWVQPSLGALMARSVDSGQKPGRLGISLSPREREVLRLVAFGYTNAEVARVLGTSRRTVEGHRNHIMQKLGLQTRAQLVRHAVNAGILHLDPPPR
jgi:two-component system, NarL family, response regulator NreC